MRKRGLFRRYIWEFRYVQESLETEYKQTTKVCAFLCLLIINQEKIQILKYLCLQVLL